ncbi:MAG: DNA translocase FtsK [Patescibacteria group bacterium]|nr:DNA translocase FtsK [Patescibacteria group bacterium]MDD5121139.1 DNA translocase FtsK [Patescibacteria group bacterium]MDD5221654.1 DNA translocase FtsK [Patescibacteria group bacterium]MDD5395942.1 DNA translocase FtsK [Patescibacteria group bacterium]
MITFLVLLSIVSIGLFIWFILEVVKLRKGLDSLNKKLFPQENPDILNKIYEDVREYLISSNNVSASIFQIRNEVGQLRRIADGEGFVDLTDKELLPKAREAVIKAGRASASLIQRRLRVGYARAAALLDFLEAEGTIGPGDGAEPREIITKEVIKIL